MTDDVKERCAAEVFAMMCGGSNDPILDEMAACIARQNVDAVFSALRPGDEIGECVLVPKDQKPTAWLGWFAGAGSENSHYEFTRHEETARRWSSYGEVTPLYVIPALAAAKKG